MSVADATETDPRAVEFIERWAKSGGSERANYALFLTELCDLIKVQRPDPTSDDPTRDAYVFERAVTFHHPDGTTSTGRIDLYKRGCFVLEAKQGTEQTQRGAGETDLLGPGARRPRRRGTAVRGTAGWDDAMIRARGQAEQYAKALPAEEGWPPFLVIVDVGHCIELFADFSGTGKHYTHFPDATGFRIPLAGLSDLDVQEALRQVWTDPLALDPSRRSARVTRRIAQRLALLARSLEDDGHPPRATAEFLMRCLFTMFAEDVELLPRDSFSDLLKSLQPTPEQFQPMVADLWETMDSGGFSTVLRGKLPRFNGGLFAAACALPLNADQLDLLIDAADADWRDVEPAIFGTLLERALDPRERHKLGAHYTPRSYVERLVLPTVIEPLRSEWEDVKAAAIAQANSGDLAGALAEVRGFHQSLCEVRVLDPACGSGNFLYVTLEHMKRLEGEILDLLVSLGQRQGTLELPGLTVDPHQFLGLEVNPRAAVIAELVLWIGFLQWHFRTRGKTMPAEPVLKNFANIACRDALITWDTIELVFDGDGRPKRVWDQYTTKPHPVTGEDVPDETATVDLTRYVNVREEGWPEADFVVGNPPFIGTKKMKRALGVGYVEALRRTVSAVPDSADYVMYWWHRAASLAQAGRIRRFGFITTNSISQVFNRQVMLPFLASSDKPQSLVFTVPDHPWSEDEEDAAVRIAMTVAELGAKEGRFVTVKEVEVGNGELPDVVTSERSGIISAKLSLGPNLTLARRLKANSLICRFGMALHGSGFILKPNKASEIRPEGPSIVRPYIGGRDLTQKTRELYVIDFSGMTEDEARRANPAAFQHVIDYVLPERQHNPRGSIHRLWWRFGWERPMLRQALAGISRYIATVETAKHRTFQFIPSEIVPAHKIVVVASDDAFTLGILSSRYHVLWALAAGGRLGVGNDPVYNNTMCFDTFPFPVCSDTHAAEVRRIAEEIDEHRKGRRAAHSNLTITGMYNVLAKLRNGDALSSNERRVHEQGLVGVLSHLHDQLDDAVATSYGWPSGLDDEEILFRLMELNRSRTLEERRGDIRWLRPDFQVRGSAPAQAELAVENEGDGAAEISSAGSRIPWPAALREQVAAVRSIILKADAPVTAATVAKRFAGRRGNRVEELLDTLVSLGQAKSVGEDKYSA